MRAGSEMTADDRRELERNVEALGEALRCSARVAPRVLAQLDDSELERLRQSLLHAFTADF